ncbi:MAG: hypothetical protein JWP01_2379 [Myxococcales bacterium]|nr:hypothetical protein [Myxococcales bacterium]
MFAIDALEQPPPIRILQGRDPLTAGSLARAAHGAWRRDPSESRSSSFQSSRRSPRGLRRSAVRGNTHRSGASKGRSRRAPQRRSPRTTSTCPRSQLSSPVPAGTASFRCSRHHPPDPEPPTAGSRSALGRSREQRMGRGAATTNESRSSSLESSRQSPRGTAPCRSPRSTRFNTSSGPELRRPARGLGWAARASSAHKPACARRDENAGGTSDIAASAFAARLASPRRDCIVPLLAIDALKQVPPVRSLEGRLAFWAGPLARAAQSAWRQRLANDAAHERCRRSRARNSRQSPRGLRPSAVRGNTDPEPPNAGSPSALGRSREHRISRVAPVLHQRQRRPRPSLPTAACRSASSAEAEPSGARSEKSSPSGLCVLCDFAAQLRRGSSPAQRHSKLPPAPVRGTVASCAAGTR